MKLSTIFTPANCVLLEEFIAEAIAYKGNVTRDKDAVLRALEAHLQKHTVNGVINRRDIVDTIRHQFTTYDDSWKALENRKARLELDDYLRSWNDLVKATAQLVDKFVVAFISPGQQEALKAENHKWLATKLRPVHDEEDDDPRAYRSGFRAARPPQYPISRGASAG